MSGLDPGDSPSTTWFPIGRSDDAPRRHVFQAKLLGRELAVWRADDGFLNVWENRCLHRGVRLSTGLNEGTELKCMYHGWRYASRSAGCTYIPAHPADAPAQTICNQTFPWREEHGLIWTTVEAEPDVKVTAPTFDGTWSPLRSLPFNATPDIIVEALEQYSAHQLFAADQTVEVESTPLSAHTMQVTTTAGGVTETVILFIQPMDSAECLVHSIHSDATGDPPSLSALRAHASELERIRERAEDEAARRQSPEPMAPSLEGIDAARVAVAPRQQSAASLRVVVERKWSTADGVAAFELAPLNGELPTAQPGAHIDVQLPNGLVRQYSLTNASGDHSTYTIGVKREPESRGGSACLHDTVREGDVLAISHPRNNFSLRRDAAHTVLIAGGIGITPLLAMALTLDRDGHSFALEYFAQSGSHLAFTEHLTTLGSNVTTHLGLSPAETTSTLEAILANPGPHHHVYICGPGPMLDAARSTTQTTQWPDKSVHFEYFKNTEDIDDSSAFDVHLARSGLTLGVRAGETILDVLKTAGVALPSSCEQGACGTCIVGVLDGEPLHQDVYLRPTERAAGDRIATCVSRARSNALTLDI